MTQKQLKQLLKQLEEENIPYEFNMLDSETEEMKMLQNMKIIRLGTNAIAELLKGE